MLPTEIAGSITIVLLRCFPGESAPGTHVRFSMFNNNPYGGNQQYGRGNRFGSSRYQYQTLQGSDVAQGSGLMSKVLGLLAVSFIFASLGAFLGIALGLGGGSYFVVV